MSTVSLSSTIESPPHWRRAAAGGVAGKLGLVLLLLGAAVAILGPYVAPYSPTSLVGPPLDPPSSDHVGDLVPAPPPDERRGHAGIALDPDIDLLVVALGHAAPTARDQRSRTNRTCVRVQEETVHRCSDSGQLGYLR